MALVTNADDSNIDTYSIDYMDKLYRKLMMLQKFKAIKEVDRLTINRSLLYYLTIDNR